MKMKREFTRNTVLVSAHGGILDVVSDEGEVLAQFAVSPGRVRASRYLDLVPQGATLQISEGLTAFHPRSGVSVQQPDGDGLYETGANPDYRPPGVGERLEREMRLAISRMNANSDRLERRERALAAVERIPDAVQVIEEEQEAPAPAELKKEAVQADEQQ